MNNQSRVFYRLITANGVVIDAQESTWAEAEVAYEAARLTNPGLRLSIIFAPREKPEKIPRGMTIEGYFEREQKEMKR